MDNLQIVREIIKQHVLVRHNVEAMGTPMSDIEALFSLQKAQSAWSQGALESLSGKEKELEQVIERVDYGLKTHFGFEEKWLPPLLGDVLLKWLILQHRAVGQVLDKARTLVTAGSPAATEQAELLGRRTLMQQAVGEICQHVEQHIASEEVVLKMLTEALSS